jgi:hypothetical protein
MDLMNARTPILNAGDVERKREEIRRYFHATHSLDEQLYDTLASPDAFYLRPEPLRYHLIFYLGHTATFYINKLIVAKITNQRINPRFESMFAVGVDEMSWDDLNEAHCDWPTPAEVKAYRDQVRTFVDEIIRTRPFIRETRRKSQHGAHALSREGDADPLARGGAPVLGYAGRYRSAINALGRQREAGCGADAAPDFRIFNPAPWRA